MLQPTNRLTLIDGMRPPASFRLEGAMAVTFTLNLQALLAAPAAFAIAGSGETTDSEAGGGRPVELIHALRTNAHKLTVFSEAGMIGLPPSGRAFAFLERAVVPVKAPRGGIVHPKVWVLRYQATGDQEGARKGDQRLRVLISSRNLTFDTSWDTVLRLDEFADSKGARLDGIGELFVGLLDNAVGEVASDNSERVESLTEALRTARFELPTGVDDLDIHVLGLAPKSPPLPTAVDRSLIISPFLTEDFFSRLVPQPVDTLVSRQGSLDGISESTLKPIKNVLVLDSAIDDLDNSDSGAPEGSRLSPDDPGRALVGLHAKVFAFEKGNRAQLFVGSANATGPAFRSNLEILAELRGAVAEMGIDRLCEGDGDELGLRKLFQVYHRLADANGSDGSVPDLDRARRAIAVLPIRGLVESSGEDWAVTYSSTAAVPDIKGTEIHCRPLTTPGSRRRITPGEPFELRFETSLDHISGFLAFELRHESGEQTGFVVPVPLDGMPEHRDRYLLKLLIGNAERFLRYLLALLYEDSSQLDIATVARSIDINPSGEGNSVSLAVLEKLLRTMRTDPLKLAGLHPLIVDLKEDDALPPGFAELWEVIGEVLDEGVTTP